MPRPYTPMPSDLLEVGVLRPDHGDLAPQRPFGQDPAHFRLGFIVSIGGLKSK